MLQIFYLMIAKMTLDLLPKSVRLQILLVLSFIWTTVFSLYIFSYKLLLLVGQVFMWHILDLIFAVYMTFNFHKQKKNPTVFLKQKILIHLK